ncbi:MAG: PAS domain S-box protein, partial [Bacteroidales bacterium]|nr:PAS domain S-box protein [Bacteroidales bacterium]
MGKLKIFEYEKRYVKNDNSHVWVHVTVSGIYDMKGSHLNSIGTVEDISKRKLTEEKARESSERLRLAVESANLGTWDLDLVKDVANRSLRHDQIWGYNEFQKQWGLEIAMRNVIEDDRKMIMEAYEKGIRSGQLSHENRVIWPDESIHWIRAYGQFYYDLEGKPVRVMGIMKIYLNENMQKSIFRKESGYFEALQIILPTLSPVLTAIYAIYSLTPTAKKFMVKQKKRFWVKAVMNLECLTKRLFYGKNFLMKCLPQENKNVLNLISLVLYLAFSIFFRYLYLKKNNRGEVVSILAITRDITELKRSEQKLHTQAMMLEQVHDAIFAADNANRITYINKAAIKQYEIRDAEKIIGSKLGDHFSLEWVNPEQQNESAKSLVSKNVWKGENFFTTAKGKMFWADSVLSVTRDESGKRNGLVAIVRDISEKKHLEEQLLKKNEHLTRVNELLEDFVHIAAHDLRGPMGNIVLMSDYIDAQEKTEDKESAFRLLPPIVKKLQRTVDGLMET